MEKKNIYSPTLAVMKSRKCESNGETKFDGTLHSSWNREQAGVVEGGRMYQYQECCLSTSTPRDALVFCRVRVWVFDVSRLRCYYRCSRPRRPCCPRSHGHLSCHLGRPFRVMSGHSPLRGLRNCFVDISTRNKVRVPRRGWFFHSHWAASANKLRSNPSTNPLFQDSVGPRFFFWARWNEGRVPILGRLEDLGGSSGRVDDWWTKVEGWGCFLFFQS